ncbi:MAG: hypothetical protein PHH36_10085 [Sideroxydans sp.]|nr:hypothetical protein [Sideroxydans sp.]
MSFNFGAFAGGMADGYQRGESINSKRDEMALRKEEHERLQAKAKREEAYLREVEALQTPIDQYKQSMEAYQRDTKQSEQDASVARTTAEVMRNTAADGVLGVQTEQQIEPLIGAPRQKNTPVSIVAKQGLGAANAMMAEAGKPVEKQKPQAPQVPGFMEWMDYTTKRAAIDLRHNKIDGAGFLQLAKARKMIEDEGMRDAMLRIHGGDIQSGIDEFNKFGDRRIRLIDAKPIEADISGIKMQSHVVTFEDDQGNRQTINAAEALNGMRKMEKQLATAIQLMQLRQKDKYLENKGTNGGGLTIPQQRTNIEIDAAREYVKGMSPEEIQRRTQQYSATGRENTDYDPLLASKVRLSQRRKYGEDTDFENIANPPDVADPDIGARFSADPSMKGYRLGSKTQHGVEVFDASGKLIGHYN